MTEILLTPIRVDALFLSKATPVREGLADFTRLPYSDGQQDHNPDIAYLAEEILAPPFQDKNLMLPAGVHLHWYLPGVLTKTKAVGDKKTLPAAPDRWVVTRFYKGKPDKNWLVESDFLSTAPAGKGLVQSHVPWYDGNPRGKNQPYRFLGRVTELGMNWNRNDALSGTRIAYLTAAGYEPQAGASGYGEPTFAAFYPHCSSVFGFCDPDIRSLGDADPLSYQILGFYGRAENDYFTQFVADFVQRTSGQSMSIRDFNQGLKQAIEAEFLWRIDFDTDKLPDAPLKSAFSQRDVLLPTQNFFSARVELHALARLESKPVYRIAAGNTGTEALSAFLAEQLTGDKALIEDQLEAVQFTSQLNNRDLDTGAKFKEARHEKGFGALSGETHWTVVLRSAGAQKTNPEENVTAEALVPLADLNLINSLQAQYEKAQLDLDALQKQLYSDWNKYMLCAYPPPDSLDAYPKIDEAKDFIEHRDIRPINLLKLVTGTLSLRLDDQGNVAEATAGDSGPDTVAAQLAAQINKVLALVRQANTGKELIAANKSYALKPVTGPRFWRPNDPVVLLARQGATRNGVSPDAPDPRAVLDCLIFDAGGVVDPAKLDAGALIFLQKNAAQVYQNKQLPSGVWENNAWQPFLLEWEVELFPAGANSNLQTGDRAYTADFVGRHYQLEESETDFSLLDTHDTTGDGQTLYSGISILTPNAGIKLQSDLKIYLLEWVKNDMPGRYFKQANTPEQDRTYAFLLKNISAFAVWINGQINGLSPLPDGNDPELAAEMETWWQSQLAALIGWYAAMPATALPATIANLVAAYHQLDAWQCLAQSLGGFNEALLMRKQTRQLEIADPIGFPEYQDFTDRVRQAIDGNNTTAPQPLNDFAPLRSGYLQISALRLVDNFGQVLDIATKNQPVTASEPLRDAVHPDRIALRPRLSQAARLNLRWLSAQDGKKETNTHPDSNPICGWLMPNYLDNSIDVYDAYGQAIGVLTPDPDAPWQNAPGNPFPVTVEQIENIHLRRVVQFMYNQHLASLNQNIGAPPTLFIDTFMDTLETALENIDPENFARHPDLALLMGRPIAVVRVSLDLQLLGVPAPHQGWNVFIKQLQGAEIETDDFERVEFPVRLGERRQLNDGLIGYWPEQPNGQLDNIFYSPVAAPADHPNIVTYQEGGAPMNVAVNVQARAKAFTLLFDPRGKLHATSGILPTKAIDIPVGQYAPALQRIEVSFQVTPLLSDAGKVKINLPAEPGFAWSWLEQTALNQWQEIPRTAHIGRALLAEKIPSPPDLWDKLVAAGWLVPSGDYPDRASVTPKDQRSPKTPPAVDQALLDNVDRVFDAYAQALEPAGMNASFSAPQALREGWLKLSPEPTPST